MILRMILVALACLMCGVTPSFGQSGGRRLAKNLLTVIPPAPVEAETFSGPVPIVELVVGKSELNWEPPPNFTPKSKTLFEMSKGVTFRREIWNLELAFKPVRMIEVDVPQPTGKMQRKKIWYMVYRVKYLGYDLGLQPQKDNWDRTTFPDVSLINYKSRRFLPHFVLRSHGFRKEYLDRIIPAAKMPILMKEFPGKLPGTTSLPADQFFNSVTITEQKIGLSDPQNDRSVWGVVTWEDVDPRTDYFSIYIQGLTNAFRFEDPAGAFKPGDKPGTGRQFEQKTLQLNFWRPGDTRDEDEKEIRFGIPVIENPARRAKLFEAYGIEERLDYLWIYR